MKLNDIVDNQYVKTRWMEIDFCNGGCRNYESF